MSNELSTIPACEKTFDSRHIWLEAKIEIIVNGNRELRRPYSSTPHDYYRCIACKMMIDFYDHPERNTQKTVY